MFFFFFQAEDGIRDLTVTGVQTCALPRTQGAQRDRRLDAPPRRVRQALSQVMGVVGATGGREISRRMVSERASQQTFLDVSALLFAASAAVAIVSCASMSATGDMPMTGC